MLFLRSVLAAAALFASTPAHAYTQADSDAAAKWITEDLKFPMLNAFTRMTPKLVRVVMENYMNVVKPDTFEYLSASDVETIFTAVSAANNCELCLSFHAMALGGTGMDAADVDAISAGGLPADESAKKLVVAAKYALAHKGIILPREKLHLAELGFDEEMMVEVVYVVGQMTAMNQLYVHLISEGIDVEDFLKAHGPFAKTVYKEALAKAEL
ncbi:hypothetical protein TrST_g3592 [Triparma strigata]|uniref:Carboxymuconolactone decarboxylase-like domain-containing protein n=1 Tax=Triparma strigata TaxID=1606541 RepID=A0A9W7BAS1_9STRA|nr:hypothetical protein TrST_g3592 [Triparma strigata]